MVQTSGRYDFAKVDVVGQMLPFSGGYTARFAVLGTCRWLVVGRCVGERPPGARHNMSVEQISAAGTHPASQVPVEAQLSALLGPLRRAVLRRTRATEGLPDLPEAQIELL